MCREPVELPADGADGLAQRPCEGRGRRGAAALQPLQDRSGERLGQDPKRLRLLREVAPRQLRGEPHEVAEVGQRGRAVRAELPLHALENRLELDERRDPVAHVGRVAGEHPAQAGGLRRERRADLREREAEAAERDDRVEALGVVGAVAAVPGLAPFDGLEQPDRLVVTQRPDRQSGRLRELADPERCRHGPYRRP